MEEQKLPQRLRTLLDDFIERLKNIYKEDLVSVILYGSAASGEFTPRYSNVNILIILTDAGIQKQAASYALVNSRSFKIVRALFLTEAYIDNSSDVFPVEFLDMKENHAVLYGKDVLVGLKIELKNLRFQCEQELKSKLINIKRFYLTTRSASALKKTLFASFTSVLHILRNILRLKRAEPPYSKEEILQALKREVGIDSNIFNRILEARKTNPPLSHKEIDSMFVEFVNELERMEGIVDRL